MTDEELANAIRGYESRLFAGIRAAQQLREKDHEFGRPGDDLSLVRMCETTAAEHATILMALRGIRSERAAAPRLRGRRQVD